MSNVLDCGHGPSDHGEHTTGTAHTSDGRTICWSCSNAEERAAMAKADHYTGYLSDDGKAITTWPGGHLATITRLWSVRNNFAGSILRFWAIADHKTMWYGTSPGRGMYARMHRSKVQS